MPQIWSLGILSNFLLSPFYMFQSLVWSTAYFPATQGALFSSILLPLSLQSTISPEPFYFYSWLVFRNQSMGTSYGHSYCGGIASGAPQGIHTDIYIKIDFGFYVFFHTRGKYYERILPDSCSSSRTPPGSLQPSQWLSVIPFLCNGKLGSHLFMSHWLAPVYEIPFHNYSDSCDKVTNYCRIFVSLDCQQIVKWCFAELLRWVLSSPHTSV